MTADVTLDCYGLVCPMPIIQAAKALKGMTRGQVLEVDSNDPGFREDLPAWCRTTGQEFLGLEEDGGILKGYVRKVRD